MAKILGACFVIMGALNLVLHEDLRKERAKLIELEKEKP